jgi:hypothetical protein
MPFHELTPEMWKRLASRVLIFGPPNSFKTTSLLSWLACGPVHLVSFPGEAGYATLPLGVPGLKSYVWEEDLIETKSPAAVLDAVNKVTLDILTGKNGPVTTVAFDGLHKFCDLVLDDLTGGAYGRGEEFSPFLYPRSYKVVRNFLKRVNQSNVRYAVFTTWNDREPDKQGDVFGGSFHEWPALPGKMAKLVLGEFSVVVFSKVTYPRTPTEKLKGEWLLKPDNEVWGSFVKIDPRIAGQLPARVPQNWQVLEPLLLKAYEKGREGAIPG